MSEAPVQNHEADAHTSAGSSLNLFQIVWRFKLIILLGTTIGLVVGYIYASQLPPTYQSSAKVLVVKRRADAPLGTVDGRTSIVEDYLATHQQLIRSPLIVDQAVKKRGLGCLASFKDNSYPTGSIISALKVSREMGDNSRLGTSVLVVSYTGPVATDCRVIIDAVIDTYVEFLESKYQDASMNVVNFTINAKKVLEQEVKGREQELQELLRQNPDLRKSKDGVTAIGERIATITSKLSVLAIQQTETVAKLENFEQARKTRTRKEQLGLVYTDLSRRSSGAGVFGEEDLLRKKLEIRKLLGDGLGEGHPKIKSLRDELQMLEEYYQKVFNFDEPDKDGSSRDPVEAYLWSLKRDVEYCEIQEKALKKLLERERAAYQDVQELEFREHSLRREISNKQALFDGLAKQLDQMNLLANVGGFEPVKISPPGDGDKVGPAVRHIVLYGVLLGTLAGWGLAYVAFLCDHSFRTPEDVRHGLGVPVIGHIPSFVARNEQENVGSLDQSLLLHHRPKSLEAEAYRGVRTALFFSTRGEGHKVIQVTSPDMSDGKTTLAANLAISIAQADKKIVLVDADLRRPRINHTFGLPNERGLSNVLTGEMSVQEVLQESGIPGLHVLSTGPVPPNPAELLSQLRFKELLDLLRQHYDFVLVDTPPLLAVTDPCAVVPHVDSVLLTIRLSKNARAHAIRAKDILAALGANIIGVVVNGVRQQVGIGYGYSDYGYGYDYTANGTSPDRNASASSASIVDGALGNTAIQRKRRRSSAPRGFLGWLFQR
jgi:polysaccharide biosynthesis transport protein